MRKWQEVSLENTAISLIDGDRGANYPSSSDFMATGHCLFLNTKNVPGRRFNFGECSFITRTKDDILRKGKLKRGDIVITTRGTVGNVASYDEIVPYENIRINSGMVILRNEDPEFNTEYLYYLITSEYIQAQIKSLSTGSAQPQLPIRDMKKIRLPKPDVSDQKSIAVMVSSIDDKIILNQRMNETLEAMASALFKSWFVDFDPVRAKAEGRKPEGMDAATAALFPAAFNDDGLPEGWEQGTIKELCRRVESGGTPSRKNNEYWDDGNIPWLTSGEVRQKVVLNTKEKITQLGLEESSAKIWPPMSTVVAMYGATAGQVTLLASPVSANQACCALIPKEYTQSFVFLKTSQSVETYEGQARGSAQQNLNKSIVSDLKTLLPPEDILFAFEGRVKDYIKLIVQNFKESETLSGLRDALLPKLISGELRIDDAVPVRKEAAG